MDQGIRQEIDTLHGRVSDLKERVATLEAQRPHIKESLDRIEQSVASLNSHISKAVWGTLALLGAAVLKFIISGGLHFPGI